MSRADGATQLEVDPSDRDPGPPALRRRLVDRPAILFGGVAAIAAVLLMLRLNRSPDFDQDEVVYTELARHILNNDAVSVARGPFLVHPPLFFLVAAAWQFVTRTGNGSLLESLHALRYLNALFGVGVVVLVCLIGRGGPTRSADRLVERRRLLIGALAGLFVATNGFFLGFGRTVLLEPAALFAGAGVVLLASAWRRRSVAAQVAGLGIAIALACLTKQLVVFEAFTPLLAALMLRDRRRTLIAVASLGVGALIWLTFPLWAAITGHGGYFWSQQTVSLRRLSGLLQTSGINVPQSSAGGQFSRTAWLYATGYIQLVLAAIVLVALVIRTARRLVAGQAPSETVAVVIAYSLTSFAFFGYSFAFGQGNQQFTMYTVPVSALLCAYGVAALAGWWPAIASRNQQAAGPAQSAAHTTGARTTAPRAAGARMAGARLARGGTLRAIAAGVVSAFVLGIAVVGWAQYYVVGRDDGTTRAAAFITRSLPACTPVNASGNQARWQVALPHQLVTDYDDGPTAQTADVHVFLLSPKDARNSYGNMSPQLATWIRTNGTIVYRTDSRSSEGIQVWQVGPTAPSPTSTCAANLPVPVRNAPAATFAVLLGGAILIVIAGAVLAAMHRRRHDQDSPVTDPPAS